MLLVRRGTTRIGHRSRRSTGSLDRASTRGASTKDELRRNLRACSSPNWPSRESRIPCVGLDRPPAEVWEALRQSPVGFVLVSEQGDLDGVSGWLSREDLATDADAYRSSPPESSSGGPRDVLRRGQQARCRGAR